MTTHRLSRRSVLFLWLAALAPVTGSWAMMIASGLLVDALAPELTENMAAGLVMAFPVLAMWAAGLLNIIAAAVVTVRDRSSAMDAGWALVIVTTAASSSFALMIGVGTDELALFLATSVGAAVAVMQVVLAWLARRSRKTGPTAAQPA